MKFFLAALLLSVSAQAGIIPSHEQQIQLNLAQGMVRLSNFNSTALSAMFNQVWRDRTIAPCQVWTDMGASAAATRTAFFSLVSFINGNGGNITLSEPPGYTMTQNNDGTVTCVAPTPSPSPSVSPSP